MRDRRGETDVGRMYEGMGLSIDKMLGNHLKSRYSFWYSCDWRVGVDWQEAWLILVHGREEGGREREKRVG